MKVWMFIELVSGVKYPKITTVGFVLKRPFVDVSSLCRYFPCLFSCFFLLGKGRRREEEERRKKEVGKGSVLTMERLRFKRQWFREILVWVKRENCMRLVLAQTRETKVLGYHHQVCYGGRHCWVQYALGLTPDHIQVQTGYECSASHLRHGSMWSGDGEADLGMLAVGWRIAQKITDPTKGHSQRWVLFVMEQ